MIDRLNLGVSVLNLILAICSKSYVSAAGWAMAIIYIVPFAFNFHREL